MVNDSRLLCHWAAGIEDNEVWDTAYIEAGRQFGITFRIDLHDDGLPGHVCRRTRNLGCRHSAGTTPPSPEIDQHWDASILDNLVEHFRINFQRLVQRRQRSLARATFSVICEMSRRDAVLLSTSFAGSNYGHNHQPRGLSGSRPRIWLGFRYYSLQLLAVNGPSKTDD
jgi:hypothetical protein